jgi:hypothetical protein
MAVDKTSNKVHILSTDEFYAHSYLFNLSDYTSLSSSPIVSNLKVLNMQGGVLIKGLEKEVLEIYSITGQTIRKDRINGEKEKSYMLVRGLYILRNNGNAVKLRVN